MGLNLGEAERLPLLFFLFTNSIDYPAYTNLYLS